MNFIDCAKLICHYGEINNVIDRQMLRQSQKRFIGAKQYLIMGYMMYLRLKGHNFRGTTKSTLDEKLFSYFF